MASRIKPIESSMPTKKSERDNEERPVLTVEARQNQLISLATDCAEQQLRDGTASSQVITHYLKLGTMQAQLECAKLEHENQLLAAKTRAMESSERSEIMYREAIEAFKRYSRSE